LVNDFSISYTELQATILDACWRQAEWPAKVAVGIYAAVDFAGANPTAARTLIVDAQPPHPNGGRYLDMIHRFCDLLAEIVPSDQRLPAPTDKALIGGIATVMADHLRRDRLDRLAMMAPDLIYLTLLPYLGFAEAKRWAQSPVPPPASGM